MNFTAAYTLHIVCWLFKVYNKQNICRVDYFETEIEWLVSMLMLMFIVLNHQHYQHLLIKLLFM